MEDEDPDVREVKGKGQPTVDEDRQLQEGDVIDTSDVVLDDADLALKKKAFPEGISTLEVTIKIDDLLKDSPLDLRAGAAGFRLLLKGKYPFDHPVCKSGLRLVDALMAFADARESAGE